MIRSLRAKMLLAYLVGIAMIFAIALVSWDNLNDLRRMVSTREAVTELFEAALEIRRYEKNYFLYAQREDLESLRHYVEAARSRLGDEQLRRYADPARLDSLDSELLEYARLAESPPPQTQALGSTLWARTLREKGKGILEDTEDLNRGLLALKHERLRLAKAHLFYYSMALIVMSILGGVFFYRKALVPLTVMQEHMAKVSAGDLGPIDAQFRDSELVALKVAFNKMILELQSRQSHIVQQEKLAALGTLVFGVAHELNNPLSNISTSCQILNEEIEGNDLSFKRELLGQIEQETDRARDVVGSLLDYSRAKVLKDFNLAITLAETIRLIKAEVPPKISIALDIPPGIVLYGDKQKIQQVFLNLIKNAVDACGHEGDVRVSAMPLTGDSVEILVSDNGEGMDQGTIRKIFDPFFSSKTDKKGYGLGLFIVHNIVEEHGGAIDVDSRPGEGTIFTITLPREANR